MIVEVLSPGYTGTEFVHQNTETPSDGKFQKGVFFGVQTKEGGEKAGETTSDGLPYGTISMSYEMKMQTSVTSKISAQEDIIELQQTNVTDIGEIDPTNASYNEMMQLMAYLIEQGRVADSALDFIEKPDDPEQRMDYLALAREWKVKQRDSGDMVGYHQTVQVCEALCNLWLDNTGKSTYIETENGLLKVEYAEAELTSGILGGVFGSGGASFYANYADHSTADNPIVEIHITNQDGIEEICYVDVNAVNPKYATELEIFALLVHYEKQGVLGEPSRLYYQGCIDGVFDSQNPAELIFEKKNWLKRLEQYPDLKITEVLLEFMRNIVERASEIEDAETENIKLDGVEPEDSETAEMPEEYTNHFLE